MTAKPYTPPWVYQSFGCDVWQFAHACNYMAEHGWEPLMVTGGHAGQQTTDNVRDESGPLIGTIQPIVVLFRRPSGWGREE